MKRRLPFARNRRNARAPRFQRLPDDPPRFAPTSRGPSASSTVRLAIVQASIGLHGLLETQAYRLASWRTAFDEINYRRFFDVNDLAAIRMEDPRVFEASHALLLDLVG